MGEEPSRPSAAELLELMAVLAHDLRTPLTPIKGYAEIMRSRSNLGAEKTEQYAAIIVEAGARMERSVDLLSGLCALYGGRAEIRAEPIRAVDVVAERLDIWRGRVPARSFEGQCEAAYGAVIADRGWLGQALDVLIDRALRTWPAPAAITLGARTQPGGQTTRFTVGRIGAADASAPSAAVDASGASAAVDASGQDQGAGPTDRLGRAFVVAVSQVCGYALTDAGMDVPVAAVS